MPPPGEAELIAGARAGDETAFRLLFRAHTPVMFGVACRMLAGNVADTEDAIQEAWLRAVRGLQTFRGESSLRTWLVGIAVRCALESTRTRRRADAPPDDGVHAVVERPHEQMDLERVIASLADGYRHVVVLHDIYGYTHEEIGELLGVDAGTSKSQLSRARQIIRRSLGDGYRSAST